ncbi:dihydrofolate reductase family protein [Saccharothrix sp.]|uniref:dihydrofolate reductase family protein n=1 Tax=Saccharothrix sp. TaxID=1873460 RepID=UPI002810CEA1|nr:dihydrofolate reductase family protein [Saccharothrix sp.]
MGIVTCGITVSVDGFVAGPDQTVEDPLGVDGELLHRWMFEQAEQHPAELAAITDAGAFVMGRNMFGPVRGEWEGDWRGWWGDDPPYHAPVFVLTHHPREPVEMVGGTTFHFVTDGVEAALERAREVAGERNVAVAGGASVVNQCLAAGLIDELWLHVAPMTLGGGARLFEGVGRLDLEPLESRGTDLVTHTRYRVRG